jgi:hypothetical protein
MRKLATFSYEYMFDKKGEEEEEEKEKFFSFVTFCHVYPQNWRLLICFDVCKILFVLNF